MGLFIDFFRPKNLNPFSVPLSREHKFISFGVCTHREMHSFSALWLWLPKQLTSRCYNFCGPSNNVRYLKAQTGPSALTLAAAMYSDDSVADLKIGHCRILPDDFRAEEGGVESYSTLSVCGPDNICQALDVHYQGQ